jgi:SRSO17 transposase
MDTKRPFAGIGREGGKRAELAAFHERVAVVWASGVPSSAGRAESPPELAAGGVWLIDESADERAGNPSAGAGRQYNGRLGKGEMSPGAVLLSYVYLKGAPGFWSGSDGAWCLPQRGFGDSHQKWRQRLGVPQEGSFKTPVELAWKLRERALAAGLALERVGFDGRYGRNRELRAQMRQAGKLYRAEVAADTHVYLDKPLLGLLPRQSQHGRPPLGDSGLGRGGGVHG